MKDGIELNKDVFISYTNRGDKDHAQRLCDMVEAMGVGCWIAPRDIPEGKEWADVIPEAIDKCQVMALLLSDASMGSDEIRKEMNLANSRKKPILPIRMENIPLRLAFEYHLSTRQWVDAYEGDFETRFKGAVTSILTILKSIGIAGSSNLSVVPTVATGIAARAQKLERELNRQHQERFTKVNAFLTFIPTNENQFSIRYPVRIGSPGVDIWLRFDSLLRPIWFYTDLAVMDSLLKWPFITFCRKHFLGVFKSHFYDKNSSSRRWEILTFLDIKLPEDEFLPFSPEQSYEIFERHVRLFVKKVLPPLLDWIDYGRLIESRLLVLKERIRAIFPCEEGWMIEAPQGNRLEDWGKVGGLNIYREVWAPNDNYLKRGYLSFRIQTDEAFLGAMKIGILKTEGNLQTGSFAPSIFELCSKLAGVASFTSDWWVWCQWLDEPWKNSGINNGSTNWRDNPDGFIQAISEKLQQLREVIPLLDQANQALPALQIQPVETLMESKWEPIFIRSWLVNVVQQLGDKFRELTTTLNIRWDYHYRVAHHWILPFIQGQIKVGNFDFAITISISQKSMLIELKSIDPPHFEAAIIKRYLANRLPGFTMDDRSALLIKKLTVSADFDGGSPQEWMQRFIGFASEQFAAAAEAMKAIHSHLNSTLVLVNAVKAEISAVFPSSDGWRIRDEISTLDQINSGLLFWNINWLQPNSGSNPEDMPPLVIKLGSNHQLFDGIYFSIRRTEIVSKDVAAFEFGAILGACQIVFGKGGKDDEQPWWFNLSDGFDVTGASAFEKRALIEGEERTAFLAHIRNRLLEFKRIEHLFKAVNLTILASKAVPLEPAKG